MNRKKPENPRCLYVQTEQSGSVYMVHVRVAERCEYERDSLDNSRRVTPYCCTPERSGDLFLARSLGMTSYGEDAREKGKPLSVSFSPLAYRDCHIIHASDVEAMAHTFKLIEKRLAKLRERFGHANDFAETCMRLADAVDAKWLGFPKRDYARLTGCRAPQHEESHAVWHEIQYARSYLERVRDHLLPDFRGVEPLEEMAAEAAQS